MLTHGSLFSGIGGFDLGFERAGIKTIWQVEIDDYCRRVLARHFPTATRYDDVRTVGKHNLAPVDIVSGGFPCQDISNAGKRAGIDGERSGLWSEYARIIRELRPRFVVVENVAALLHRGMERVLGDLAACGYDAEWQSIRASDVGAPHRRERIWIVAYPARSSGRWPFERTGTSSEIQDGTGWPCPSLADTSSAGRQQNTGSSHGDESANERRSTLQAHIFTGDGQGYSEGDVANTDSRGFAVQGESPRPNGLASRSGEVMANTDSSRRSEQNLQRRQSRDSETIGSGEDLADASGEGLEGQQKALQPQEEWRTYARHSWKGTGGIGRDNWWAVEPDVGRVAHGIPLELDCFRRLNVWASDNPKAKSEAGRISWRIVQFVWIEKELATTSPDLYRKRLRDLVSIMPREAAHNGWLLGKRLEKEEELCDLWHRVYAAPFEKAQDMLPELLERIGKVKRPQKVASRVDRLRGLGNAIVPQIAEWIGHRLSQ